MSQKFIISLALILAGILVFAIGAAGTASLIQIGIGIFLALLGGFALIQTMKN